MNKYLTNTDSLVNLFLILLLHTVYFSFSYLIIQNLELLFAIPLFVIISLIHHKFLGEFIHEGSHYHLHKSKKVNELISNFLKGVFFFVSVNNYRKKHFKHHEYETFFNPDDPETGPLKILSKKEFWKNIFFDLTGFNGLLFLLNYANLDAKSRSGLDKKKSSIKFDKIFIIILIMQITVFILSIFYNFVLYYLIYYFTLGTLYHLQLRFRIICQHIYLTEDNKIQHDITTSRTIKGGLLEKLFFTSDVTAYHDLHHKSPQYPFRKCREIFKEKGFVNDKNIFSKTRSDIVYKYYKSLA